MKRFRDASRGRGQRNAFTIVEILVVVIIIGVLATLIVPRFFGRVGTAKQSVAKQKIEVIGEAIHLFHTDYDRYPQSLDELVGRPGDIPEEKWVMPTVKAKDLIDPWGRVFIYRCPGQHDLYDLYSLGADGLDGGGGENSDVVSW